jgi:Zn-dependent peptidase ImmA (M78 family)
MVVYPVEQARETPRMSDTVVDEAEATHFAMCLLMPRDMVHLEVRRMGGIDVEDGRAMAILARKFRVSPTLMAIRIGWLMCERSRGLAPRI